MSVILFGYYGYQNVGDEQLLDETVRLINELQIITSFKVANGPFPTPFPSFNRWNIISWIRSLRQSSALIFGGGSIFQSKSSQWSLFYYLFIVQLAKICNCRIILLCNGWGPFKQPWHEKIAAWMLMHTHRSWRAPIPYPPFINDKIYCDLTLTQPIKKRTSKGNNLGLSLKSIEATQQLSSHLKSKFGSIITLCNQPPQHPSDHLLSDYWTSQTLKLSFIVTDRYHTAIWASQHGIPWAAISNDPKCILLAQRAQQPCYATLNEFISSNNWETYRDGRHLRAWASSHQFMRTPIKNWLHENISN